MKRPDLVLLGVALLAGALFFATRGRLWPGTGLELVVAASELEARARSHADAVGLPGGAPMSSASSLELDLPALSWLESTRDQGEVRRLLRSGVPVYRHVVRFKRSGDPSTLSVYLRPNGDLDGWDRTLEDDIPGTRLDSAEAWTKARTWILLHLGVELGDWRIRSHARRQLDARTDHEFLLEHGRVDGADVRERFEIRVAGDEVVLAHRETVVPPAFLRELRSRKAPEDFVRTLALTLFASLGCVAFLLKLNGLRKGMVGLRTPAIGAGLVLVSLGLVRILRPARLLELWDPMGPQWMAAGRVLLGGLVNDLLPAVMVFSFLAASDALDRQAPRHRGIALRNFLRLRWNHVDVGHASIRGFLLGLVAGGLLAGATWALSFLPGARVDLQPRGFFFHGINSSFPTIVLGAFFLQIALVEELGYRHFAANALLRLRLGALAAALVPALVYGAVHAGLDFLPPGDPWWARLVPITLVGALWGFAFLRWDALTVVLSHWACDLFVFNQPRLASADAGIVLSALACISLPLLPALVSLGWRAWHLVRRQPDAEPWSDDSDFDGVDPPLDVEAALDLGRLAAEPGPAEKDRQEDERT